MAENVARVNLNIKIFTLIAYLLLIGALAYLAIIPPVSGYELSIYTAIPFFWIFALAALSLSIILMLYQSFTKNFKWFWYVFLIILLGSFLIFCLPMIRGYYIHGGNDPNSHLSNIARIVGNGNFNDNYYPITHVFGAVLSILTNLPVDAVVKLVPPIFSIVFITFTYYLALIVFKKNEYATIAAALSSIPLFSYYNVTIYPHAIALLLLPIVFYLYFRSAGSTSYKVLLFILLVTMAFVHVIPSLIICGCLVTSEIIKLISKRINTNQTIEISFIPAAISFIVFFLWWSAQTVFSNVNNAYTWFAGEAAIIPRTEEVEAVYDLGQLAAVELYLKMYGIQLALTILSLIAIAFMIYYFLRKREELTDGLSMAAILLTSAVIYILIFLSGGFITIGRLFGANYGIWAMPVVVAFLLFKLNYKKVGVIVASIIIIVLLTTSMFSVYRSAWILQPNWQFTYHDIDAYQWFQGHNSGMLSTGVIGAPWGQIPKGGWAWSTAVYTPPHFGYTNDTSQFGESLARDSLVYFGEARQTLATKDPILKNSSLGGTWALPDLTENDMEQLHNDTSVNFVYSCGDVKVLRVTGLKDS